MGPVSTVINDLIRFSAPIAEVIFLHFININFQGFDRVYSAIVYKSVLEINSTLVLYVSPLTPMAMLILLTA